MVDDTRLEVYSATVWDHAHTSQALMFKDVFDLKFIFVGGDRIMKTMPDVLDWDSIEVFDSYLDLETLRFVRGTHREEPIIRRARLTVPYRSDQDASAQTGRLAIGIAMDLP